MAVERKRSEDRLAELERLKELGVELLFLQDQTFVGGVTPELAMTRRHYPISTPLGYTSGPMWTAARSSATWSASTTEIPRSCLASHGVPAGFPMPSAEPIPNLEASPTFASPGVGRVSIPSRSLNGSGLGALQQERSEAGAKEPLDMNTIDDNIIDMRKKLPPKERLSQLVGLRMRPEEYRALKREGEAHGLDLQNYVRMLVKTHQSRKAGK